MKQVQAANRRRVFLGAAAAWSCAPLAAIAQDLLRTPLQALGPFYPDSRPLEEDADLASVRGQSSPARGEITHLAGRILDARGGPLRGVRVEIWQCDANGRYHHPRDTSQRPLDPGFQGFGASLTDPAGSYAFRTIRPVPYPGRTPHIHFRVAGQGLAPFVTQMYIAGHAQNERDALLNSVRDPRARASLLVNFMPIRSPSGAPEYSARFDIVLGVTPPQA